MNPSDESRQAETAYKTLMVIWSALLVGVVAFGLVSYLLLRSGGIQPAFEPTSPAAFILVTLGFVLLIAAPFVGQAIGRRPPRGRSTPPNVAAYQISMIASHALREAAGLLGAVTVLGAGAVLAGYALLAAAVLMMLKGRPRREHLEELYRSSP